MQIKDIYLYVSCPIKGLISEEAPVLILTDATVLRLGFPWSVATTANCVSL